jgi:hypothetical protein
MDTRLHLGARNRILNTLSKFRVTIDGVPATVAERSKACTVFARSEAGIMVSNPTQGMDVLCSCMYLRFFVFVFVPCDELITRPRSPIECLRSSKPK